MTSLEIYTLQVGIMSLTLEFLHEFVGVRPGRFISQTVCFLSAIFLRLLKSARIAVSYFIQPTYFFLSGGSPVELLGWLVECCFTSTETVGLLGTGSPGRPPRLSHST